MNIQTKEIENIEKNLQSSFLQSLKKIELLIEKIVSLLRDEYIVIDDLIRILFPFKTNKEVAKQVIKEIENLNAEQLLFYLGRLNNFAEFLLKYFLSNANERIDRCIEEINKCLNKEYQKMLR